MELQTKLHRQLLVQRQLQHQLDHSFDAPGELEGIDKQRWQATISLKNNLRERLTKHVMMQQARPPTAPPHRSTHTPSHFAPVSVIQRPGAHRTSTTPHATPPPTRIHAHRPAPHPTTPHHSSPSPHLTTAYPHLASPQLTMSISPPDPPSRSSSRATLPPPPTRQPIATPIPIPPRDPTPPRVPAAGDAASPRCASEQRGQQAF